MRETEIYKLKLIETSDTFSPDALNQNAGTLEAELTRMDAALSAAQAGAAKAQTTADAAQTALAAKAPKDSPVFTGTPKAPTAAAKTNTTQIATTAFVTGAVETEVTARAAEIARVDAALTALNGVTSRCETFQYTGDGGNAVTHTFGFPPKLFMIQESNWPFGFVIVIRGQSYATRTTFNGIYTNTFTFDVKWQGNSVTFTSTTSPSDRPDSICNKNNVMYYGIVIG